MILKNIGLSSRGSLGRSLSINILARKSYERIYGEIGLLVKR